MLDDAWGLLDMFFVEQTPRVPVRSRHSAGPARLARSHRAVGDRPLLRCPGLRRAVHHARHDGHRVARRRPWRRERRRQHGQRRQRQHRRWRARRQHRRRCGHHLHHRRRVRPARRRARALHLPARHRPRLRRPGGRRRAAAPHPHRSPRRRSRPRPRRRRRPPPRRLLRAAGLHVPRHLHPRATAPGPAGCSGSASDPGRVYPRNRQNGCPSGSNSTRTSSCG